MALKVESVESYQVWVKHETLPQNIHKMSSDLDVS